MIPTLGIITVFCGFSAIAARFAGDPGPMNGTWIFNVNNTEHDDTGSKPVKTKETITVAIGDSDGTVSSITMQGVSDGNQDLFLVGTRVGTAFFVQTGALGGSSEFITISGTIGKPGPDGASKTFKATGSSVGFDDGGGKFAVGTSDGENVNAITLFKLSAKRAQLQ